MKNNVKNQKLKLLGTIGLLAFSCIAFISATVSWFTAIRNTDANTNDMNVYNPEDFDVAIASLQYNDELKSGVAITEDGDHFSKFGLQPYDTFIAARNANLSIIFEITITSNVSNPEASNLCLTIPASTNYTTADGTNVDDLVSNVVHFRMCRYSYTTNDGTEHNDFAMSDTSASGSAYKSVEDKKYNEARKYLTNNSYQFSSFVDETTLNNNLSTVTKSDSIVIRNIALPQGYSTAVLYLELDYSTTLTDFFYKHSTMTNTSGSTSLTGNKALLRSDINVMNFSIGQ